MAPAAKSPWWSLPETCTHCGGGDVEAEGRRVLVLCSACFAAGTHTGCHEDVTGEPLSTEITHGDGLYFCGKECQRSYETLEAATGRRVPIRGEPEQYTFELVQYKKDDRTVRSAVETAMRMFRSSFAPLIMENGRDLLEMVCTAYETPDEEVDEEAGGGHNFSAFRLAILRMGGTIITAATLRVFGCKFAEMPFVSTREGHRRSGHCKRLMKAVEDLLLSGGVHCLVIPSINELLPMWTAKFGFAKIAEEEVLGIEDWIVDTDRDTCTLVKKYILPPGQPQPQSRPPAPTSQPASQRHQHPAPSGRSAPPLTRVSAGAGPSAAGSAGAAKPARKRGRAPKLLLTRPQESGSEDDSDGGSTSGGDDDGGARGGKRRAGSGRRRPVGRGRGRASRSDSESDFVPEKEAEDDEDDGGGGGGGSDEELEPEEPLEGTRGREGAAAAAAATVAAKPSSKRGGGGGGGSTARGKAAAASDAADGPADKEPPPKPKRRRAVAPRAPRPRPQYPTWEPPPRHPIYGMDVSVIRVPDNLPPAPPPMPPEVDLARPGLPNKPFELSMHLQAFIVEKAAKAAARAATAAAASGTQPGGAPGASATAPSAAAAVASSSSAAAAPLAAAAPSAAVTVTTAPAATAPAAVAGATAIGRPPLPPAAPQVPPPPTQQQQAGAQPGQPQQPQQPADQSVDGKKRRRKRPRNSDPQQQQARRHRGRRAARTPAQEAARQRRLRIRLAARQRRRAYRELMMGFILAEVVALELRREAGLRVPEPLTLAPAPVDPRDIELARLRAENEALQRALRQRTAASEIPLRPHQALGPDGVAASLTCSGAAAAAATSGVPGPVIITNSTPRPAPAVLTYTRAVCPASEVSPERPSGLDLSTSDAGGASDPWVGLTPLPLRAGWAAAADGCDGGAAQDDGPSSRGHGSLGGVCSRTQMISSTRAAHCGTGPTDAAGSDSGAVRPVDSAVRLSEPLCAGAVGTVPSEPCPSSAGLAAAAVPGSVLAAVAAPAALITGPPPPEAAPTTSASGAVAPALARTPAEEQGPAATSGETEPTPPLSTTASGHKPVPRRTSLDSVILAAIEADDDAEDDLSSVLPPPAAEASSVSVGPQEDANASASAGLVGGSGTGVCVSEVPCGAKAVRAAASVDLAAATGSSGAEASSSAGRAAEVTEPATAAAQANGGVAVAGAGTEGARKPTATLESDATTPPRSRLAVGASSSASPGGASGGGGGGTGTPSTPPFSLADVSQAVLRAGTPAGASPPSPRGPVGSMHQGPGAAAVPGGDHLVGYAAEAAGVADSGGGGAADAAGAVAQVSPRGLSRTAHRLTSDMPHPRCRRLLSGLMNDGVGSASSQQRCADPWGGAELCAARDDGGAALLSGAVDPAPAAGGGGSGAGRSRTRPGKRRIVMLNPDGKKRSTRDSSSSSSNSNSSRSNGLTNSSGCTTAFMEVPAAGSTTAGGTRASAAATSYGGGAGASVLEGSQLNAGEAAAVEQLAVMAAAATGCSAAAAASAAASVAVTVTVDGARPPRPRPLLHQLCEMDSEAAAVDGADPDPGSLGLPRADNGQPQAVGQPASMAVAAGPAGIASAAAAAAYSRSAVGLGQDPDGWIASPVSLRRFETSCLHQLLPQVVAVLLADTPPPPPPPPQSRRPRDTNSPGGAASAAAGGPEMAMERAPSAVCFTAWGAQGAGCIAHQRVALLDAFEVAAAATLGALPPPDAAGRDKATAAGPLPGSVAAAEAETVRRLAGTGAGSADHGLPDGGSKEHSRKAAGHSCSGSPAGAAVAAAGAKVMTPPLQPGSGGSGGGLREAAPIDRAFSPCANAATVGRGLKVSPPVTSAGGKAAAASRLIMLAAVVPALEGDFIAVRRAVDPYEAVMDDSQVVGAAAATGTAAAGAGAGAGAAPVSSEMRPATTGAAAAHTGGSPQPSASPGVRRRRLTRRKQTAANLFGEDVVLSASAPSDSPDSPPPRSDPPTPESGTDVGEAAAAERAGTAKASAARGLEFGAPEGPTGQHGATAAAAACAGDVIFPGRSPWVGPDQHHPGRIAVNGAAKGQALDWLINATPPDVEEVLLFAASHSSQNQEQAGGARATRGGGGRGRAGGRDPDSPVDEDESLKSLFHTIAADMAADRYEEYGIKAFALGGGGASSQGHAVRVERSGNEPSSTRREPQKHTTPTPPPSQPAIVQQCGLSAGVMVEDVGVRAVGVEERDVGLVEQLPPAGLGSEGPTCGDLGSAMRGVSTLVEILGSDI